MTKLFDMDNKYKFFIVVMLVLFFLVISVSIFFSLFDFKKKDDTPIAVVLSDGDLVINYNDGVDVLVKGTQSVDYQVSITNNSESRLYYSILLNELMLVPSVSLEIRDEEDNIVLEYESLADSDDEVLPLYMVEGLETVRYTLHFEGGQKSELQAKIHVINESNSSRTFADLILLNNEIKTNETRIGTEIATSDEGLIAGEDDNGISYYFRGNVANNYVLMGDYSFRIVRINGDGSVRLVLEDEVLMAPYNTNTLEEGKELSSLLDYSKASLNAYLESWAKTYLQDYTQAIISGDFCVDMSFSNYVNGINYSTSYDRIYLYNSPSLKCEGTRFKAKIGLLSIDEVIMAGAVKDKENKDYYLYNSSINSPYLLASSYFINSENTLYLMRMDFSGKMGEGIAVNEEAIIRPVINIGVDAKVKGKGTKSNPYIIVS